MKPTLALAAVLLAACASKQPENKVSRSMVTVTADKKGAVFAHGFIASDGVAAVPATAIDGADRVEATLHNNEKHIVKDTIETPSGSGFALLRVAAGGLAPVPFGDSRAVAQGQRVYAFFGTKVLEARLESAELRAGVLVLPQTLRDLPTGHPVVDAKGAVLGTVSTHSGDKAIIPAHAIQNALAGDRRLVAIAPPPPARDLPGSGIRRHGSARLAADSRVDALC